MNGIVDNMTRGDKVAIYPDSKQYTSDQPDRESSIGYHLGRPPGKVPILQDSSIP